MLTFPETPIVLCHKTIRKNKLYKRDYTAQKIKFSIKDFLSKSNQIYSFLRIWSHLMKKPLMENLIFCAVGKGIYWPNKILFFVFSTMALMAHIVGLALKVLIVMMKCKVKKDICFQWQYWIIKRFCLLFNTN